MGARCVEAAPGQQQVANDSVAQVPLQSRNAAESWDQAETQLGKAETRHLVGNNQIADQGQFEASAKGDSVHGCDGSERSGIDGVEDAVNALQKVAYPGNSVRFFHLLGALKEFAQIGAGTEPRRQGAVDDQRMRLPRHSVECTCKSLE